MRYERAASWLVIDNEVVAIDETEADVHLLSGASAVCWQLVEDYDVDAIISLATTSFEIDPETARVDVQGAIDLLLDAGLIRPTD